jgi:hypothetical protein
MLYVTGRRLTIIFYKVLLSTCVTNRDTWTIFSFSLPLFITCTITVGHVTDDLYFHM